MATNWELIQQLIQTPEPPGLGPERRALEKSNSNLRERIDQILEQTNFRGEKAELIRSGVLLWHDELEASHVISQSIENSDGSFLHGIMHRREPDYGNAKYWFRRVGSHKIFPQVAERAKNILVDDKQLGEMLLREGQWDPFAFVDQCESATRSARSEPRIATLRGLQAVELRTLLEHICQAG